MIHQPHKTHYFQSRSEYIQTNDAYGGWVNGVFTLKHLPGRVFVLGPAQSIQGVRHLIGIQSQPLQIPRAEWGAGSESTQWLPWVQRDIPPRSWVRILKGSLCYTGDLAYVVGSARETDALLIAVVPRIHQLPRGDEMMAREGSKTAKQKGKRRKQQVGGRKAARLPRNLFDPDTMSVHFGRTAVRALPFTDKVDFINIFADKYANQVAGPDANTDNPVALDLPGFDWADVLIPQENVYQFDQQLFYHGLLVLPIYSYGAVENVAVPAIDEVVPFAESGIDPVRINSLLSQLHWQAGDCVSRAHELFKLEDVQMDKESVSAFRVQVEEKINTTLLLPMKELQRKFFAGDGVIVIAGSHKGQIGTVLHEEDAILHVLTDYLGNYISAVSCSVSFIADIDLV